MFTPQGTKIVSKGDEPLTVVNRTHAAHGQCRIFRASPLTTDYSPKGWGGMRQSRYNYRYGKRWAPSVHRKFGDGATALSYLVARYHGTRTFRLVRSGTLCSFSKNPRDSGLEQHLDRSFGLSAMVSARPSSSSAQGVCPPVCNGHH
jgi:hypothetical protein